jgi:hypothetical protein
MSEALVGYCIDFLFTARQVILAEKVIIRTISSLNFAECIQCQFHGIVTTKAASDRFSGATATAAATARRQ